MWIASGSSIIGWVIHLCLSCCCASRRDVVTGKKRGSKYAYGDVAADEKRTPLRQRIILPKFKKMALPKLTRKSNPNSSPAVWKEMDMDWIWKGVGRIWWNCYFIHLHMEWKLYSIPRRRYEHRQAVPFFFFQRIEIERMAFTSLDRYIHGPVMGWIPRLPQIQRKSPEKMEQLFICQIDFKTNKQKNKYSSNILFKYL